MMYLSDLNDALDHKITDGSDHLWQCWPNSRFLDYQSKYAHVSAIFNTATQEIYQVIIDVDTNTWNPENVKPYRWLNPKYKTEYYDEAKERGIDPDQAWDDVKWCDLEVANDFLEKAISIFNGDASYDKRIIVPLDLDDSSILKISLMAHERDITLNAMFEELLEIAIKGYK